jgi:DNA-binding CsgD family transcriptional regulator
MDPALHSNYPTPLSTQEEQILVQVASGYSTQEIADRLSLNQRTVDTHRANLQTKLGIDSRLNLVAYAAKQRLLEGHWQWLNENHD